MRGASLGAFVVLADGTIGKVVGHRPERDHWGVAATRDGPVVWVLPAEITSVLIAPPESDTTT